MTTTPTAVTPSSRPAAVKAVNFVGRTLTHVGIRRPRLTPESLQRTAQRKSGHDDFGSDSFMPGLEALLYSIEHEAQLHQTGRIVLAGEIVQALANRLTVVAWEKAHPELAAAPVGKPMIILGLGRTGTTILHEMLAAAPGMRAPLEWEVTDYSLVNTVKDSRSDERIRKIDANIARTDKLVPGYSAIHFHDAHTPSECIGLTSLDLCSERFSALAWAPTYRKFLLAHDHRSVYRWHRRGLRFLQANTPRVRWVLKTPMHSGYLTELLETYPDALIISPHREPLQVIASLCSLYATLRCGFSDNVDVGQQAAADAAYAAQYAQRAIDFRREHPDIDTRICDIAFKAFLADPEGTLAGIYDHFGLELGDEARTVMLDYLRNRHREKYGKHRYSLDQFGLTTKEVSVLLTDYTERFGSYF